MREEVLVLRCQDGLSQDERYLLPGDHLSVFSGELDQDRAAGVVDSADGRRLETKERLEVGEAAPVEIDAIEESDRGKHQQQSQRRGGKADRTVRPCGPQSVDAAAAQSVSD